MSRLPTLKLENLGPIASAQIAFGDLTVLVGPQATGKSIALQFLKLVVDAGHVQAEMLRHGLDWSHRLDAFLDAFLGEGLASLWRPGESRLEWGGRPVDLEQWAARRRQGREQSLFYIPAQRVLTLRDGWPRPFSDYRPGDPFMVREFSENLRLLMEQEFGAEHLFPQRGRLKGALRDLVARHLFAGFSLRIDRVNSQKRLVLRSDGQPPLPYMVWSAGQREFVPLLLGLYWLLPPTKVTRRANVEWVVLEELEMGLHARAVSTLLLFVFELLARGYRVCLSTHSPQVLEAVWTLGQLGAGGDPKDLLRVFDAPTSLRGTASRVLAKVPRVYFFDRDTGGVQDITGLDPAAAAPGEAGWGGLADFSARANDVVARAVASRS